jgi:hypothetical protein
LFSLAFFIAFSSASYQAPVSKFKQKQSGLIKKGVLSTVFYFACCVFYFACCVLNAFQQRELNAIKKAAEMFPQPQKKAAASAANTNTGHVFSRGGGVFFVLRVASHGAPCGFHE